MRNLPWPYGVALLVWTAALLTGALRPVLAQVQRSGGGESQRIMQQYQQLAAEKTSLQSQIAQQKKDLDAAKADLAAMTKERDALKTHVSGTTSSIAQANAAKQAAEQSLEKYKQSLNELVVRFRETATNLRAAEGDRDTSRKDLTASSEAFDRCAESNVQLSDISREVLDRYDHVGLFTKVGAAQPFSGITRNRIDNLVVEYRARVDALRVHKANP